MRDAWIVEYNAWRTRRLDDRELVYAWADGIYIKAGLEKEKAALLVVIGAMSDGRKEILAIVPGYRESTASWTDVLRDLRDREMRWTYCRRRPIYRGLNGCALPPLTGSSSM